MTNYRPMFEFGSTERKGNAQVFATWQEANESAKARFIKWTMPSGFGVDETSDPVNYKFENNQDIRL